MMKNDWQQVSKYIDDLANDQGLSLAQIEDRTRKHAAQAAAGNNRARFAMSFAYYFGLGIPQDKSRARQMLREASSTLDTDLLHEIGMVQSLCSFYEDAYQSFQRAYRLGHPRAALELGMLAFEGRYCEQDTNKAISLCKEAASNGVAAAAYELGRIYDYLEDKKTAVVWMAKAAEMGNVEAQAIAGEYYAMKGETDEVIEQGIQWIENSAKQGHVRSVYMLAVLIAFKKIEGTMQQAFEYCQDAATQGYGRAQYMLSGLYENGDGVEQNDELAQYWLTEAIKNGNESAIALEKRNAERRGRNADSR